MINIAEVSRVGFLDMQVCVPSSWTDDQAIEFAETENPCGTENGWAIRKEGSEYLNGSPERAECLDKNKCNFVHITLDA